MLGSVKMPRHSGRRSRMLLSAAIGAAAFAPALASAQTLTWDNNGNTVPNPQDGLGTWDLAALNWWDGTNNVAWSNPANSTAVFGAGGVGGTVTLAGSTQIGGLRFDLSGYSLTGGGLSITGPVTIGQTVAGANALDSAIGGTGDVTWNIAAGGTINSNVAHGYAGNTTISGGGILNIATFGTVNGTVTLDGGGIRFRDTRVLTNAFVVPTGSTGTIALIGNGTLNGAISGAGTLVHDGTGTGKILSPNADNSAFTGTMVAINGGIIRFTNANAGSPNARFQLNGGSISNRASSVTIHLGELTGTVGSALQGSISVAGLVTYSVGALNTDAQFDGNITNGSATDRRAAIQKVGTGRWTITGTNTYTGNTTIDNGTLTLGPAATIATTPVVAVNGPGQLEATAGFAIASGQTLIGNAGTIHGNVVAQTGSSVNPGAVAAINTLNFTNELALAGGELRFDMDGGNNDKVNVGGNLNLVSGAVYLNPIGGGFSIGNHNLGTYGGALSGAVSNVQLVFGQRASGTLSASGGLLNVNITGTGGTGTLTWTGAVSGDWAVSGAQNFFNADPTINGPDAFFQNDHVIFGETAGVGTTTVNKIGLIVAQSLTMNASSGSYTIGGAGTISGSFGLNKSGDSTLIMATANSFTGITQVNGGTLQLNAAAGAGTAAINLNSGTLMLGSGITYSNAVNINSPSVAVGGNGTFTGAFTDFGTPWSMVINSGQTTSLAAGVFSTGLATGNIDLGTSNGALRFFGTGAASVINASSSTIDLGTGSATMLSRDGNGGTITIGALAGGPNTTLRGASTTNAVVNYVLGGNNASTTMAGTIANGTQAASPAINIIKNGAGTMTLGGNNTYTGTTVVNSGGLIVNGTHTGGGAYTLASGTTFGGKGTITAGVTLGTGVTVNPGASVGTLTVGSLSVTDDTFNYEIGADGGDAIVVTNSGGLAVAGNSQINISDAGGAIAGAYPLFEYSGSTIINGFSLNQATLGAFTASLSFNGVNKSVDLILTGAGPVTAMWNVDSDANWSPNSSWTGGVPNAVGSRANFLGAITAPRTVTVDGAQTVSQISFHNSNSYTLSGTGAITLDVASGAANVNVFSGSHSISAPLTSADDLSLNVAAGGGLSVSNLQPLSVAVTKTGGGTLAVNNVRATALAINAGNVSVLPNGTSAGVSNVTSLTQAAGTQLDLTNNGLVVDYTATDPTADIRAAIISGYAAGSWNGNGITSSTAAADPNGHAVGYARSSEVPASAYFGAVDATATLARYTRVGDANLDGTTNISDFSLLAANFNAGGEWVKGDFNYDGLTNISDFSLLAANFNLSSADLPRGASLPGSSSFALLAANFNQSFAGDLPRGASVPEPATLSLLALAGLAARRRR